MELEPPQQASAPPVAQPPAESPRSDEVTSLLGKDHCTDEQLRRLALALAWITIVIHIYNHIGLSTFIYCLHDDNGAAFASGLYAILNIASLAAVIWRFYVSEEVHSRKREKRACTIIGSLFILSSLIIFCKSIYDIIVGNEPVHGIFIFIVSAVNSVIFLSLAVFKFIVGRRLESPTLIADAFNSLIAVVMSVNMLICSGLEELSSSIRYVDAVTGLLVSIVIFVYGARLIDQSLINTSQPDKD